MSPLQQLRQSSEEYLHASIAASTRRNYMSALRSYSHFCRYHSIPCFPTSENTLILYATHVASYSSHANVKLHMAAIKHFSIIRGFSTPFGSFNRLYLLTKGIRRKQGSSHAVPKRLPITPTLLHTIAHNLFNSTRLYEDKTMLWAAILLAFFGFLRVSEYTSSHKTQFDPDTTLLFRDIDIRSDHARICIKASKTDPFREGVCVRVAANNTRLCPIRALHKFLSLHPSGHGPLFAFHNGRYLTRKDINDTLNSTTNGLANISTHSLRIGAASTAAAMGCPKWLIQGMGRWTSDCFRRYIRITDKTIRRTSKVLANCHIPVPSDFNPLSS